MEEDWNGGSGECEGKNFLPHLPPEGGACRVPHPYLHKVVSLICTPTTTYPFVISKLTGMTVSQVADEVLNIGLIEMQELDAQG